MACWDVKNNFIEFDALTGNQGGRLLYSAQNPHDKSQFAVASAHEKLSIWSVKNQNSKAKSDEQLPAITIVNGGSKARIDGAGLN